MRIAWLFPSIAGAAMLAAPAAAAAPAAPAASAAPVSPSAADDALGIPARLAVFRTWKALTSSPQPIPYQLAQLCAALSPSLPDAPDHGPHANRWVMAYANPAAASALTDADIARFPAGSVLAKEKRASADAAHPEGVAFMVKHKAGTFAASGGWEFLYFPSADASARYDGCIACHRSRGNKDYVFGRYGPTAATR